LKGLCKLTVEGSGSVVYFYADLRGRRRGVGRSQAESVRNARSSRRRRDLCTTTSLSSNLPLHHLRTRLRSRGIARLGVFQTSVLVSRLINYTAILETHYTPCFRKKIGPFVISSYLCFDSYELHDNFLKYIVGVVCCEYGINVYDSLVILC